MDCSLIDYNGLVRTVGIFHTDQCWLVADDLELNNFGKSKLNIGFPGQVRHHDQGNRAFGFSTFLVNGFQADTMVSQNPGYFGKHQAGRGRQTESNSER